MPSFTKPIRTCPSRLPLLLLLATALLFPALAIPGATAQLPPDNITVLPIGLERGRTQQVRVEGAVGEGPFLLWTSFGGTVAAQDHQGGTVRFNLDVPAGAPLGVGGVRLIGRGFLSATRLVFVDDLPTRPAGQENQDPARATPLPLPSAVSSRTQPKLSDFYGFHARSNQVISLDLLARRLGSRFDPILRVLNAKGEQLGYNDFDRSFGADTRIAFRAPEEGDYRIEVRDLRNGGGPEYGYHLRVGEFPMPDALFPLAVREGTNPELRAFATLSLPPGTVEGGVPPDGGNRRQVLVRNPGTPGFSALPLRVSPLPEIMDSETNQPAIRAQDIQWPVAINGRFQFRGDVDWYRIQVQKGDRLSFRSFSQSLGSPSDVVIRLVRTNGTQIVELDQNKTLEPMLDHTFEEAGSCLLRIWEGTAQSLESGGYRVEIERSHPRIRVQAQSDHAVGPAGMPAVFKVTVDRRDTTAPVRLRLAAPVDGLRVEGEPIPGDRKEGEVKLVLTNPALAGKAIDFRLVATAEGEPAAPEAAVTTETAPNFKWLRERRMPAHLNGHLTALFIPAK